MKNSVLLSIDDQTKNNDHNNLNLASKLIEMRSMPTTEPSATPIPRSPIPRSPIPRSPIPRSVKSTAKDEPPILRLHLQSR